MPTPEEMRTPSPPSSLRLTQEAPRRHPEALDEDRPLLNNTLLDALEDD
jgi:hypothetical protein